ncbi:hypothetical protein FACS1894151_02920 [Spirochaetia bacterium]|nr:hypothetical protein FACS1894151_02920 [Spirochaetia bacterium]
MKRVFVVLMVLLLAMAQGLFAQSGGKGGSSSAGSGRSGTPAPAADSNDKGVITIPNNTKAVADNQFAAYTTTAAPKTAFDYYSGALAIPNSVTTIGVKAFQGNKLTAVTVGTGVTEIKDNAFTANMLTALVLPNNVTKIGSGAFSDNQLASITLGANVHIGNFAFRNNPALSSITIGANCTIANDNSIDAAFKRAYATGGAGTYTKNGNAWTKK